MKAIVSSRGQITLPRSVRQQAGIHNGDTFNIASDQGIIVLRKVQSLTEKDIQFLAAQSRRMPPLTPAAERKIEMAIQRVRRRKSK